MRERHDVDAQAEQPLEERAEGLGQHGQHGLHAGGLALLGRRHQHGHAHRVEHLDGLVVLEGVGERVRVVRLGRRVVGVEVALEALELRRVGVFEPPVDLR